MIIDGIAIATEIQNKLKAQIDTIKGRKPCLAVILVGEHSPSKIYVSRKTKACAEVGIQSIKRQLPASITENELLMEIEQYNVNPEIDGILIQLPLPSHINPTRVTRWVNPEKDVDGFHPINMGKLLIGESDGFLPCTPLGVKKLLDYSKIDVAGKHVLVVGRSNTVGKPMAAMLMQNTPGFNATITVSHRQTPNLKALCLLADILIVAVGQPGLITEEMVKEGAVVIDVGINKIEDLEKTSGSKIVGDVDFERVKNKCSFITPVPGGVGPMTIAMLLNNTLKSYHLRHKG